MCLIMMCMCTPVGCTGIGLEAAIEHSVLSHKSAVSRVSNHRLSAVNVALTAKRELKHNFESYLQLPPRKHSKQMVLDEDIQVLIDALNASFGSKFADLREQQQWSKFAMKGVKKVECGAQRLEEVWGGIPDWVESLTTSCGGHQPLIFEPPDVDDPTFIDLTLDSDSDSDSGDGNGSHGLTLPPPCLNVWQIWMAGQMVAA